MRTSRLLPEGDHALASFFQSLHLAAQDLQVLWLQHQHTSLHKSIVQRHLLPHAFQAKIQQADAARGSRPSTALSLLLPTAMAEVCWVW